MGPIQALRAHAPEYAIEGALLGVYMVAACAATALLHHPSSPIARRLRRPLLARAIMGALMGLTAVAMIYSPLGRRSGAHLNPAVTLTYLVLGKIAVWDAAFYVLAQFAGGIAGVGVARLALGRFITHARVNHAPTVPGPRGRIAAWAAEFAISLGLMSMVLASTNHARVAPYTGVLAGLLIAMYITVEAPLSGMSMNPARTLASAIPARAGRGLWIYFTAPPLAMLSAAALHLSIFGPASVYCAKLHHPDAGPCLFNCRFEAMPRPIPHPER